jgi:RHS repeat-associated protein
MKLAGFVNGALHYYLLDHLGSTKVITNASGVPVEYLDYEAFGSPQDPAVYTSDDGSFERCSLQRLYGDPNKTNGQNYLYVGAKWRAAMHHCPADEYCETAASPTAADGAKVGRIYDNGSGQWKAFVLTHIFLTPNKWYRISVKARAVTNLGSKYARAYLSYNATDNEGDKQVTKLVTWGASELASGEWVRKYVIFQVPKTPNGAPNWQVSAYLYGHYGKGIIEFDDYRIEEFVTQPSGPPPETPGYEYTGKKRDSSTGLYYFGARYYDPEIGRFITEDPAKDGDNWLVYCRNNPLKYVDPTGLNIEKSTTVTIEGGEGYMKYITEMELTKVEQGCIFTVYRNNSRRIEAIKILDTPEGKEYANRRNRSENGQRAGVSFVITFFGLIKQNPKIALAGLIDAGANLYQAITGSGAAKYEAGDTIVKYTTEKTTVSIRGKTPAGCGVSITKEETIIIFDRFGNIKATMSGTYNY